MRRFDLPDQSQGQGWIVLLLARRRHSAGVERLHGPLLGLGLLCFSLGPLRPGLGRLAIGSPGLAAGIECQKRHNHRDCGEQAKRGHRESSSQSSRPLGQSDDCPDVLS
ncbi:MAG: hypothetical protein AAGC55_30650, partial [Myxococcota bacterium]